MVRREESEGMLEFKDNRKEGREISSECSRNAAIVFINFGCLQVANQWSLCQRERDARCWQKQKKKGERERERETLSSPT